MPLTSLNVHVRVITANCRLSPAIRYHNSVDGLQAEQHLAALPAKEQQLVEQEDALRAAAAALAQREAELRPREAAAAAAEARADVLAAAEAALAEQERELQEQQVRYIDPDKSAAFVELREDAAGAPGLLHPFKMRCSCCVQLR